MKKFYFVIIISILFIGCESLTGDQGEQGIRGEKGDQGDQGEKGDAVYTEIAIDEDTGTLQITDVSWSFEGTYSNYLSVTGLAKNVSIVTLDYVKIHIRAYNESDKLISTDYTSIDTWHLIAGQECIWRITDYGCEYEPSKVTIGYSYDVSVNVPAPKKALF